MIFGTVNSSLFLFRCLSWHRSRLPGQQGRAVAGCRGPRPPRPPSVQGERTSVSRRARAVSKPLKKNRSTCRHLKLGTAVSHNEKRLVHSVYRPVSLPAVSSLTTRGLPCIRHVSPRGDVLTTSACVPLCLVAISDCFFCPFFRRLPLRPRQRRRRTLPRSRQQRELAPTATPP